MHVSEAGHLISEFVISLGLEWDADDYENLSNSIGAFRFSSFLALIESKYCSGDKIDTDGIVEAVHEIFRTYIQDVLKTVSQRRTKKASRTKLESDRT